jgi:hypothetical protein
VPEPAYKRIETHEVYDDGTEALLGVQFTLPSGEAVRERPDGRLEIETSGEGRVKLDADARF